MKNPCFDPSTKTDCPNRRGGCSVTCEKWAEYVKKREETYKDRYHQAMMTEIANEHWAKHLKVKMKFSRRNRHTD